MTSLRPNANDEEVIDHTSSADASTSSSHTPRTSQAQPLPPPQSQPQQRSSISSRRPHGTSVSVSVSPSVDFVEVTPSRRDDDDDRSGVDVADTITFASGPRESGLQASLKQHFPHNPSRWLVLGVFLVAIGLSAYWFSYILSTRWIEQEENPTIIITRERMNTIPVIEAFGLNLTPNSFGLFGENTYV